MSQHSYTPGRWMRFVDGENFTIRTQQVLLKSGLRLAPSPEHIRDVMLWPTGQRAKTMSRQPVFGEPEPIRSFYYTSLVGDNDALIEAEEKLWRLGFEPHVFKRLKGQVKAKGVDIALARDMLSHAFRGNYDTAVLIAGDGDYLPLVEEIKRLGKIVEIRFFEQFTKPELRRAADTFVNAENDLLLWARQNEVRKEAISEPAPALERCTGKCPICCRTDQPRHAPESARAS